VCAAIAERVAPGVDVHDVPGFEQSPEVVERNAGPALAADPALAIEVLPVLEDFWEESDFQDFLEESDFQDSERGIGWS
jgi:hypothetical protein